VAMRFKNQIICCLLLIFSILISASTLSSCQKPATFGAILICENIDEKTFEPKNIKDTFDITSKRIYSVVKYSNANIKDHYFFTWTNLDTGEKVTSEKYDFSNKKDPATGYIVSVLEVKKGKSVIIPGKYKVELFYNEELKSTAGFEFKKPALEIISVDLTNSVNKDSSPSSKLTEFKQTDTIFACVRVNFLIKSNTIKTKWFDSKGELLLESPYLINEDDYDNYYVSFGLQNNKGILPDGPYKIEIYLNEKLFKTIDFKILKTDIKISGFEKGLKYNNVKSGFKFAIPDNWKFFELENENGFQVQIVPPSANMEIGFLLMENRNVTDFSIESFENISQNIVKPFILEKGLKEINSKRITAISQNNIEYYEIIKDYTDKNGVEWLLPFGFIKHDDKLYLLYGIINGTTYGKDASSIFYGIINSLEFI
jgi:hypothetical protein